jgi:hypothetical protein
MQTIIDELQSWIRFSEKSSRTMLVTEDTHVIPPVWPTIGVLRNWIAVLSQPAAQSAQVPEDIATQVFALLSRADTELQKAGFTWDSRVRNPILQARDLLAAAPQDQGGDK